MEDLPAVLAMTGEEPRAVLEHPRQDFLLLTLNSRRWGRREELGLGYVCGALQAAGLHGDIAAVELDDPCNCAEFTARIVREKPLLLGIACSHARTELSALQTLLATVRAAFKGEHLHVTAGGYFASFNAEQLLQACPDLDSVVVGEGELTTVDLMSRLREGRKPGLCAGLKQRGVPYSPRPAIDDLDRLAHPSRSLPWLDDPGLRAVATSRGCLAHCTFCNVPAWTRQHGQGWRGRSAVSIVEELRMLAARHGARRIWFVDSSFEDPAPGEGVARMRELAEALIQADLRLCFYVFMRAESLCRQDVQAVLPLLIRSGLRRVFVGVETGSDERLRRYAKTARSHHNLQALQTLRAHGLAVRAGWIMFSPDVVLSDLRTQLADLASMGLLHSTTDLFTQLELYTGSAEVRRLQRLGLLSGEPWQDCYAYRFADPLVAPLALAMRRAVEREGPDWHGEALHTAELAISTILLAGPAASLSLRAVTREALGQLDELRGVMSGFNELFFGACLDLAETAWREVEFAQLLEHHIRAYHLPCTKAAQRLTAHLTTLARREGFDFGL